MAVAFRDLLATNGTIAAATATLPAGAVAGDQLFAILINDGSGNTISTPASGWNLLETMPVTGMDFSAWLYERVMQGGDGNPTWTFSAGNWNIVLVAYSGQAAIDDTNVSTVTIAANAITTGSVTPVGSTDMLIVAGMSDNAAPARTWTETGSMTERYENIGQTLNAVIADETLSGTSPVTRDLTISGTAQQLGAFSIVLAEGASVPTVTMPLDFQRNMFPFLLGDGAPVNSMMGVTRAGSKWRAGGLAGPSPMGGFERYVFPRLHPIAATTIVKDIVAAVEVSAAQVLGFIKPIVKSLTPASTTDSAQTQNVDKLVTTTKATEADTAQTVSFSQSSTKTITPATEIDTARTLDVDKAVTVVKATEVDTARAQDIDKQVAIIKATEVDTARAVDVDKAVTVTKAIEVDTARTLIKPIQKLLGVVTEVDTARALSVMKRLSITKATEVDTAQALNVDKTVTIVKAIEVDTSRAQNIDKLVTLIRATTVDTARTLTFTKPIKKTLGVATELDLAQDLHVTGPIRKTLGIVSAASLAQPLDIDKRLSITKATTVDTGRALTLAKLKFLVAATTLATARPLSITHQIRKTIGVATTLDLAQVLTFFISGRTWPQHYSGFTWLQGSGSTWPGSTGLGWPENSGATWPETSDLEWEQN